MTIIARWRASDHLRVTDRFRRLGFTVDAGGRIGLEGGAIDIVPASRVELRADEQLEIADGPAFGALAEPAEPEAAEPTEHPNGIARLLAVGVAVIDLERAALDFGRPARELVADRALGSRAALVDGLPIVLLEPVTEGRLTASLARFGPSAVALYVAKREGLPPLAGVIADGPFGRCALLGGTPAWGPHLVECDASPEASSTIGS